MPTLNLTRRAALAGFALLPVAGCSSPVTTSGVPVAAPPPTFPRVQALFDSYIAARKVSGIVAAVKVPEASVVFHQAGSVAFDAPFPASADSLYRIYSMTKPITGFAAMLCVEDGRMALDQPIADFIPEFSAMRVLTADGSTRPATTQITPRHLLTHTAGLSYHILSGPLAERYRAEGITPGGRAGEVLGADLPGGRPLPTTLDEFGARLAALPLDFDPGSRWQYSVSLDLLALVIQRASGLTYEDFLTRRIFAPLRMADTSFYVSPDKLPRLTSNYLVREGQVRVIDDRAQSPYAEPEGLSCGGAGLVSSARDYARFNEMLLNEGALSGVRIANRETVRAARSNLLPEGVDSTDDPLGGAAFGAGMGIVTAASAKPGQEAPGAYGWSGAAGTAAWVDPANQVFAVLMTQFLPYDAYPLGQEFRIALYQDIAALPSGPRTPVDMLSRPRRNF